MRQVAVYVGGFDILQPLEQLVAQGADALVFFDHFFLGQPESLAHADNLVRGQRTGAETALVTTAMHLRLQADTRLATNIQGADTLRAISLVGREAHQVDLELLQVDIDLAGCLCGIDVEDDALLAADFAQLGDRLNDAHFVIDEHHGSQHGIRTNGCLEYVEIKQTIFLHVEIGRFETLALHLADGIQNRLVLGLDGDDVLALGAGIKMGSALDGEVIGFGGTGGPDDFLGVCIDQRSNLFARFLDRRIGFPAETVRTRRRVAKFLDQVGNHFFRNARVDRGGCRVIQIDGEFHRHSR